MLILRAAGIVLIVVGVLSGLSILVSAAGLELSVSLKGFWLFYLLSFVGGFVLYALGSKQAPTENLFKVAGGILVIIGLSAAVCLLLSGIGRLAPTDAGQLWALFLLCLPVGVIATLLAERGILSGLVDLPPGESKQQSMSEPDVGNTTATGGPPGASAVRRGPTDSEADRSGK